MSISLPGLLIYMLRALDRSARSIYRDALSMDPSLAQASIDRAALTMDGHVL